MKGNTEIRLRTKTGRHEVVHVNTESFEAAVGHAEHLLKISGYDEAYVSRKGKKRQVRPGKVPAGGVYA